jgi:hypothetical protein
MDFFPVFYPSYSVTNQEFPMKTKQIFKFGVAAVLLSMAGMAMAQSGCCSELADCCLQMLGCCD